MQYSSNFRDWKAHISFISAAKECGAPPRDGVGWYFARVKYGQEVCGFKCNEHINEAEAERKRKQSILAVKYNIDKKYLQTIE